MLGAHQVAEVACQERPRLLLLHGLERGLELVVRLGLALQIVLDLADLFAWKRISIEISFFQSIAYGLLRHSQGTSELMLKVEMKFKVLELLLTFRFRRKGRKSLQESFHT